MGEEGCGWFFLLLYGKVLYTYIGISGIPPSSYFLKLERFFHLWEYVWLEMKGQVGGYLESDVFRNILFLLRPQNGLSRCSC